MHEVVLYIEVMVQHNTMNIHVSEHAYLIHTLTLGNNLAWSVHSLMFLGHGRKPIYKQENHMMQTGGQDMICRSAN